MTTMLQNIKQQKDRIITIAAHYRAVNIRVFGSVAREEEREDSDVDLLVDFMPGSTLLDQVGLIDALSKELGRRADVVSGRALNKFLREKVLKEAVLL